MSRIVIVMCACSGTLLLSAIWYRNGYEDGIADGRREAIRLEAKRQLDAEAEEEQQAIVNAWRNGEHQESPEL